MKFLLSPELAPDSKVKLFRRLQDHVILDAIRKVAVVIAPSREAAAPPIIKRHTTTGVERWKPTQQAKYIRSLASEDADMDELARRLGITRGALSDSLKTDTMHQVACRLELPSRVQKIVRDSRQFNTSVLERLVQSAKVTQFLGIKFDERGNLTGSIDEEEFKKAYGRMIRDIIGEKIDTRSLNKSTDIEKYLAKFKADAPDRSKKGSFTSASLLSGTQEEPPPDKPSGSSRGPATRREHSSLIPPGIRCELKNPRINDIFRESRELKVKTYPNASGVLLRVLLELIISNYMEKTRRVDAMVQRLGKGPNWAPTLRQMLNEVLSDSSVALPPLARKGLNKLLSDDSHPLSLDKMDGFVHNHYIAPNDKELRKLWAVVEPLIAQLLVEPAASSVAPPPAA